MATKMLVKHTAAEDYFNVGFPTDWESEPLAFLTPPPQGKLHSSKSHQIYFMPAAIAEDEQILLLARDPAAIASDSEGEVTLSNNHNQNTAADSSGQHMLLTAEIEVDDALSLSPLETPITVADIIDTESERLCYRY